MFFCQGKICQETLITGSCNKNWISSELIVPSPHRGHRFTTGNCGLWRIGQQQLAITTKFWWSMAAFCSFFILGCGGKPSTRRDIHRFIGIHLLRFGMTGRQRAVPEKTPRFSGGMTGWTYGLWSLVVFVNSGVYQEIRLRRISIRSDDDGFQVNLKHTKSVRQTCSTWIFACLLIANIP